jgi:hypothetical protein
LGGDTPLIEVGIFIKGPVQGMRLGGITITASPLERTQDFHCTPIGLISFGQAQEIDTAIDKGERSGKVDGMEWRQE